jgi:hypothetical protein
MFTFFETIKLTEGHIRSTLLDLQRGVFNFIPNGLAKIIRKYNKKENELFLSLFHKRYPEDYDNWFNFLKQEEYIFEINSSYLKNFGLLSDMYEYPFLAQNITILLTEDNYNDLLCFFRQEIHSITRNIGVVVIEDISEKTLMTLLRSIINKNFVVHIRLLLSSKGNISQKTLDDAFKEDIINVQRVEYNIYGDYFESKQYKEQWVKLCTNKDLYNEIQHHHPYFNKKLFIGGKGEIKCAPESKDIHGFLRDIRTIEQLRSIVSSDSFQKYWNITKDKICICKDCEMRNMCVDNRLPIKQSDNGLWQCKEYCNYNPYIAKWSDEDGYVPVEECGEYSQETGFVPNKKKIAELNKLLWAE